jgi:hypothetical protein
MCIHPPKLPDGTRSGREDAVFGYQYAVSSFSLTPGNSTIRLQLVRIWPPRRLGDRAAASGTGSEFEASIQKRVTEPLYTRAVPVIAKADAPVLRGFWA